MSATTFATIESTSTTVWTVEFQHHLWMRDIARKSQKRTAHRKRFERNRRERRERAKLNRLLPGIVWEAYSEDGLDRLLSALGIRWRPL